MSDGMTGVYFTRPNVARAHEALLGGLHNFGADREVASRLTEICPQVPAMAREDREFIVRTVTWAAGEEVRQFADTGTGMPTDPSGGGAARAIVPEARIAYVDNDLAVTDELDVMLEDDAHMCLMV
jgi:hypothetical protein